MSYQVLTLQAGLYQNQAINVSGLHLVPLDANLDGMTVRFDDPKADPITVGANGVRQFDLPFQSVYLTGTLAANAQVLVSPDCNFHLPQVAVPLNPAPVQLNPIANTAVIDAASGGGNIPTVMVGGCQQGAFAPEALMVDANGFIGVGLDEPSRSSGKAGLTSLNLENPVNTSSGAFSQALLVAGIACGGEAIGSFSVGAGARQVLLNVFGKSPKRWKIYINTQAGLALEFVFNEAGKVGAFTTCLDIAAGGGLAAGEYCLTSDGTVSGTSEAYTGGTGVKVLPVPCLSEIAIYVHNPTAGSVTLNHWRIEAEF